MNNITTNLTKISFTDDTFIILLIYFIVKNRTLEINLSKCLWISQFADYLIDCFETNHPHYRFQNEQNYFQKKKKNDIPDILTLRL